MSERPRASTAPCDASSSKKQKVDRSPAITLPAHTPVNPPLLQVPAAVLHAACLFLPWWDRLLHLSHVHRLLPPAWLEWAEHDHVRLSEALWNALEQRTASAVYCARHVQSLAVECTVDDVMLSVVGQPGYPNPLSRVQDNPSSYHSHLHACLQALREADARLHAVLPVFGQLRSLSASPPVLRHFLANCEKLHHLHSLSLHGTAEVLGDVGRFPLSTYWPSLPALRRARVEGMRVSMCELVALPGITHLDCARADGVDEELPVAATMSSSLQSLLMPDPFDVLFDLPKVLDFVTALTALPIRRLTIQRAELSNDALHTIASIQSLTDLNLFRCGFNDATSVRCQLSADEGPLLRDLQHLTINYQQMWDDHIDGLNRSIAACLSAYGPALRSLRLNHSDRDGPLAAFLPIIIASCPLLQTLHLEEWYAEHEDGPQVPLSLAADVPRTRQPTLALLRSLTLLHCHLDDAALAWLLACCPQLLECVIEHVTPMSAAVWRAVRQCPQLVGLRLHTASAVATEAALTACTPVPDYTDHSLHSLPVFFPNLSRLDLSFDSRAGIHSVDSAGLERLFGLFHRSPITTVALHMPLHANHGGLTRAIISKLPQLGQLRLGVKSWKSEDVEACAPVCQGDRQEVYMRSGMHVLQLLERCSKPARATSEQHSLSRQRGRRASLVSEGERVVRARYVTQLTTPSAVNGSHNECEWAGQNSGWRVFKRCLKNGGEEDGRSAFVDMLNTIM